MRKKANSVSPDLHALQSDLFALLARAVKDRRSPMHTPVIATQGLDGFIKARVVVLRAFDSAALTLRFHTDRRSAKVKELAANPHLSFAFYDAGARVQIRVEGTANVHQQDAIADAAWTASLRMSRICYGVVPGPGQALAGPDDFVLPSENDQIAAGRDNFCAVLCTMDRIEYLFLRHEGHRRARFARQGDGWMADWLAP